MIARDAHGRFTTAQHADALAAERLLEAAVAEARRVIAEGDTGTVSDWTGRVVFTFRNHDRGYIDRILRAAGESADLLYRSAS